MVQILAPLHIRFVFLLITLLVPTSHQDLASQRFRRGYPQLCHEMKFTLPLQDPLQAGKDASTSLLLRVPSLTSNESKDATTTSPQQQHQAFYGSTPPVFVNYRSEDVVRHQLQPHCRPPYTSPIRIRSARGARRQSPNPTTNTTMYSVSTRGRRKMEPLNNANRKPPLTTASADK